MPSEKPQRVTSKTKLARPYATLDDAGRRERVRRQVGKIRKALSDQGVQVGVYRGRNGSKDDADMEYMYRRRTILCADGKAEPIRSFLGLPSLVGKADAALPPPINGMTAFTVPEGLYGGDDDLLFSALDGQFGEGTATPDHILHVTTSSCCPASEPRPVATDKPVPAIVAGPSTFHPVRVLVLDSGLLPAVVNDHTWLTGVTGVGVQPVNPYRPHGTFVAGVVRSMAPTAQVQVNALMFAGGAVTETAFAALLVDAMKWSPDIISMSAGTTTRNQKLLRSLDAFNDEYLSKSKGTILVAAAGNDGVQEDFYPASMGWPVAVGALNANENARALYSNYGPWVDVFARGSDVVNAFPKDDYAYDEDLDNAIGDFSNGMASWDGTSFATPLVSGIIAGRMARTGENARQAWDALRIKALGQQLPGVGPILKPGDQS